MDRNIRCRTFLFCVIYRPPNSLVNAWEAISHNIGKVIESFPTKLTIIHVLGDLNENLLDNSKHHLQTIIDEHSLYQLIDTPTRPISGTLHAGPSDNQHANQIVKVLRHVPYLQRS